MLSYNQLRVLAGCLSISNTLACIIGLRAIKIIKTQEAQYQQLWKVTKYLAHLTEENNIHLSEFDLIALHELGLVEIKDEDGRDDATTG